MLTGSESLGIESLDGAPSRVRRPSPVRAPQCRILARFDQLEEIAEDWKRLWDQNPQRKIFGHFTWARNWLEAYRKQDQIRIGVVTDDGTVTGIVPLVLEGRSLRFIGHSNSDYNSILSTAANAPAVLAATLTELFAGDGEWDTMILENLPEKTGFAPLANHLPMRIVSRLEVLERVPCPALVFAENRGEILTKLLGKDKFRKASKVLERLGPVTYRHIEDRGEAQQNLPELVRQHIRRCAVDGRRSPFLDSGATEFFRTLLRDFDLRHEIRFSALEINGIPAAYHLGFQLDGKYLYYKPTFDVDLWDQSPGQVLLYHLLQNAAANPEIDEFDFCAGGEPYKYRFASESRDNVTIRLWRPGPLRLLKRRVQEGVRRGRDQARKFPALEAAGTELAEKIEHASRCARHRGTTVVGEIVKSSLLEVERLVILRGDVSARSDEALTPIEGVAVRTAQFGELAEIAATSPPLQGRLRRARFLLKTKQTPHLFMKDGHPICVAWTRQGDALSSDEIGERHPMTLSETCLIVHSLWNLTETPGVFGTISPLLLKASIDSGYPLCVVAPERLLRLKELSGLGFKIKRRLIHGNLLGRIKFGLG